MFKRRRRSLLPTIYIVLGIIVAVTHGYFAALTVAARFFSAILAVLLWPLVLLNIHVAI